MCIWSVQCVAADGQCRYQLTDLKGMKGASLGGSRVKNFRWGYMRQLAPSSAPPHKLRINHSLVIIGWLYSGIGPFYQHLVLALITNLSSLKSHWFHHFILSVDEAFTYVLPIVELLSVSPFLLQHPYFCSAIRLTTARVVPWGSFGWLGWESGRFWVLLKQHITDDLIFAVRYVLYPYWIGTGSSDIEK